MQPAYRLVKPMAYDRFGFRWLEECRDANGNWLYGRQTFHPGEDLNRGPGNEDIGDPVYAIGDGIIDAYIDEQGWGKGLQQQMLMPEGHVVYPFYGHLKDVLVNVGDEVEAGQKIATVGRPKVQGSVGHLHFEIRRQRFDRPGYYPIGQSREWVKDHYWDPLWFIQTFDRPQPQDEEEDMAVKFIADIDGTHHLVIISEGTLGFTNGDHKREIVDAIVNFPNPAKVDPGQWNLILKAARES